MVLGVELYAAARATDLRHHEPGPVTGAVVEALREVVPGPGADRFMSPEVSAAVEFVNSGRVVDAAERASADGLKHTLTDTDGRVLDGVWLPA
jgi:histidine ammonia-lyase